MKVISLALNSVYVTISLIVCLLMYVSLSDYWGLIDFIAYPVIDRLDPQSLDSIYSNPYAAWALLTQMYVQSVASDLAVHVIDWVGLAFDYYIEVLYACILVVSLTLVLVSRNKKLYISVCLMCVIAVTLGQAFSREQASRQQVISALKNFPSKLTSDNGFMTLLREGRYNELNDRLQRYQDRFIKDEIDIYDFAYQYDFLTAYLDYDDIELLNDWVRRSSNKTFAYLLRGYVYMERGFNERGTRFIKDTSEEQLEKMQENFDHATSDLEKVIESDPHQVMAYRYLCQISAAGEYKKDQRQVYRDAVDELGHNYLLAFTLAHKLQEKWGGDAGELYRFARELRDESSSDPRFIGISGLQLTYESGKVYDEKNYDEFEKMNKIALLYSPRSSIFEELGGLYLEQKQYKKMRSMTEKCVEFNPQSSDCIALNVVANIRLEDYQRAAISAKKLANFWLLAEWYMTNAAYALEMTNEHALAADMHIRTLLMNPVNKYTLERLHAMSANKLVDDKRILPFFERAAKELETDTRVWIMYAGIMEDYAPAKALPLFERYLELVDKNDEAAASGIEYAVKAIEEIRERI